MSYQQLQNEKPPVQSHSQPAVASAPPQMDSQQQHNTTTVVSGGPFPNPGVAYPHVPYSSFSIRAQKTKRMGKKCCIIIRSYFNVKNRDNNDQVIKKFSKASREAFSCSLSRF